MGNLFMMYVVLFLIPICLMLFTEDERIHATMLRIAIPPALILGMIEMIQMWLQGFGYFMGWNLVDFALFTIFGVLQYYYSLGLDHVLVYIPEIKLLLILLAFMKLLFFVRIFEEYGFLVQIIMSCCIDLIPFITFYMIALFMFSIIFVVLNMEIDVENNMLRHVGFFQKMLMETFRSSIGEVGLPKYTAIVNEPYSKCG